MMNQIELVGRLTRDPEVKNTTSGTTVASFTLAVERDFASNGVKETDFINCVAWRNPGEYAAKYFKKGSLVAVTGRLQIRNWEDKDKNKRSTTEVVVNSLYSLGSKSDNGNTEQSAPAPKNAQSNTYKSSKPVNNKPTSDFVPVEDDEVPLPF